MCQSWQPPLLFIRRSSSPLKNTWRTKILPMLTSFQHREHRMTKLNRWYLPYFYRVTNISFLLLLSSAQSSVFSFCKPLYRIISISFLTLSDGKIHHHFWKYCYLKQPPEISCPLLGAFISFALISKGNIFHIMSNFMVNLRSRPQSSIDWHSHWEGVYIFNAFWMMNESHCQNCLIFL